MPTTYFSVLYKILIISIFLKVWFQKRLRGGENRGQKGILYLNFPEADKQEIGKITMTSASGQSRVVRAGTCWEFLSRLRTNISLRCKQSIKTYKLWYSNSNSRLSLLYNFNKRSEKNYLKYQLDSSFVIMFSIFMTYEYLFNEALILQGEFWCWSFLGL